MTTPCPDCFLIITLSGALLVAFFGLLLIAAVKDVRTMSIPNGISLAMVALYPAYVVVAGVDWVDGMIAGGAVLTVGIGLFALNWLGGGDVKLLAATSLWAGTGLLIPALFVTALAGGLLCGVLWVRQGGPARIIQMFSGDDSARAGGSNASSGEVSVVPYGVAILAGGAFVAFAQFMPIYRLAEIAL